VFAGSRLGDDPRTAAVARALGRQMVSRGIGLVYGGASVGLMGEVAESVLAGGGEVIGVAPADVWGEQHDRFDLTELHRVNGMHERKELMLRYADGLVTLPGGLGTFDELFEVLSSRALGIHRKPIALLDPGDYFGPLMAAIDCAVAAGFARRSSVRALRRYAEPEPLLKSFAACWRRSGNGDWRRRGEPGLIAVAYG
jgi:uncharacterized protein (TIGR00730 family)